MPRLNKILTIIIVPVLFWALFLNYLEPTQVGIARNWLNGNMVLQERAGWHFSAPWVGVCRIQTTPLRVCVSTASRGYSAKLVQFNKNEWQNFIKIEGWSYYWWYNRLSFNFGYSHNEEFRGFRDVMRAYAYSPIKYPFITVKDEYQND